jgi:hypothetical protein
MPAEDRWVSREATQLMRLSPEGFGSASHSQPIAGWAKPMTPQEIEVCTAG